MRQLQESMMVLTGMASRHETRLQDHKEWLESLQMAHEVERLANAERRREQEADMALHKQRMARIDEILLEVSEKLDALIHIVDDHTHGKQQ